MEEEAKQHVETTRSSRNAAAGFIITECIALDKNIMLVAKSLCRFSSSLLLVVNLLHASEVLCI